MQLEITPWLWLGTKVRVRILGLVVRLELGLIILTNEQVVRSHLPLSPSSITWY